MPQPSSDRDRDRDPAARPNADAASLFDTDEVRQYSPPPGAAPPPPPPGEIPAPPADDDAYGLVDAPIGGDDDAEPVPVSLPIPKVRKTRRPTTDEAPSRPAESAARPRKRRAEVEEEPDLDDDAEFDEGAEVDPVWSRWAESSGDFIKLGLVAASTLVLGWFALGSVPLFLLVMAFGAVASAWFLYPILITLERPVRMTPEQAVEDFFAAASHHRPHYRRMWLLLSDLGRSSGRFTRFESFRDQWAKRVAAWKSGGSALTPLAFQVGDFRSGKSAGKSAIRARYVVRIYRRGEESGRAIATFRMDHGLVKGPDRMWYLNQSTMGEQVRE